MDTSFHKQEFTTEYQLLQAYYSKRKSRLRAKVVAQQPPASKCKMKRQVLTVTQNRVKAASSADSEDPDVCGHVADKLAHIVESVPLAQDDVESDSADDVIQRLVKLLKESGDELNEKIKKDHKLLGYLQNSFSYSVFEKVVSGFIHSVAPASEQEDVLSEQKTQIAWTFETTSMLSALDLQPMNRVMGFGAQYLNQHFAPWIQQHGGWEKVFNRNESEDEVQ